MSSANNRILTARMWWIGLQPPYGGAVPWGKFSKSPQWYPRDDSWGALVYPIFRTKEEADAAFAENGFDPKDSRIVPVRVSIAEVSEEEAKAEVDAGVRTDF